jgi:carbon-monoxide dehydrogenase large subunit
VALTWASKKVGRPIKWTAERSESFLTDAHGRDHVTKAELALDADGNFLAMRVHTIANMGAYLSTFASSVPTILYATLLAGQYATPAIYAEVHAVFTNTSPVDAYRGAAAPRPPTSSSGWWKRPRARPTSTRPRCAARTSSAPSRMPRRWV